MIAGMFGALLLAFLVRRTGTAMLRESVAAIGSGLSLVIALTGVSHVLKTWAWRITLLDEKRHASFSRMLGLRLGSEAAGQLGFLGQMFGENLRVALLSSTIPPASRIASVTLDRALFVISAAAASAVGLLTVLFVGPLPRTLSLCTGLVALILLGAILAAALAVRKQWAVFSGTAELLGRVPYFRAWIDRKRSLICSVERKLLNFYHHTPGAFWGSLALNLACQAAAVLEVYLILFLLGAKTGILASLEIEGLTKLVNLLGVFNPGNLGTYEGGNMLIGRMFGFSGVVGLSLGLTRRVRAIFWAAVGSVCFIILSKSRSHDSHERTAIPMRASPETQSETNRSHIAVILAHDLANLGTSQFPRVGALPVLLRAILSARQAGAVRIAVVLNPATRSAVMRDLQSTGRLPRSFEVYELGTKESSLPVLLGHLVGEAPRVVLIAGDKTYQPSLHRRAAEWNGESDAWAPMTGTKLAGIYSLSGNVTMDLAKHAPSSIESLEELHAWLSSTHSVECEPVKEDEWQRVLTPQERLLAEQKLNRSLVKPTDGIFARMNRKVSIPISRQIIRFPITPNMVSLFTLGVSLTAGVFFAFGGYRNMLLGAILSLFASILDGCDGEVARLKLQESAFGCWLETICDYLYYLFIFSGMTIGLVRTSAAGSYLIWGGLLLFGAVASFVVTGLQRHRLAAGRPEQLLQIWQTRAASRRSNPFLYLGRHTEFIIRRCFLPYAFLFFALLNIMNVGFILAALGANVVWIIALYSHHTFSAGAAHPPTTRTRQLTTGQTAKIPFGGLQTSRNTGIRPA
jgi:phosphatidylglycerophosphate synthase